MSTLKFSVSIAREDWEKLVYLHGAHHLPTPSPSTIFQTGVYERARSLGAQQTKSNIEIQR